MKLILAILLILMIGALCPAALADEAAAEPGWFQRAFEDIADTSAATWITLGALAALGVLMIVMGRGKVKWTSDMLARGALTLAIAYVLSCVRLFPMPLGGSVTAASMMPLILFAYAYGFAPGLLCGLAYGLLQFVQKPPTLTTLAGMVLDYPIAFMLIALAAFARNLKMDETPRVLIAVAFGCLGRMLASFLSGFLFYAEYAPAGWNPVIYSFAYNGAYIGPEMAINAAILLVPGVRAALLRVYGVRQSR